MNYLKNICKYTLLISVFCLIDSCQQTEIERKPKDLLNEQVMGQILADVLLLENHIVQRLSTDPDFDYHNLQFSSYPLINDKYNLTDSQAYYSYQYYLKYPKKMKLVLEAAQDTLNKISEKAAPEIAE